MNFLKLGALVAVLGTVISGCAVNATESPSTSSAPPVEEITEPSAPSSGPLGTELSTENWKITVFAADVVPGSEQAQRIAEPGTKFVALDISACAIPSTLDFSYSDVNLIDTDGRSWTFWNVQIGAVDPNLTDTSSGIPAGGCTRGWLTMEIGAEATPASVSFYDYDSEQTLEWVIG